MSRRRDGGGEPEEVDPERLRRIHHVTRASSFGQAANVLRTGEYQHVHGRFVDALESRGGIVSVEFRGVRFDDDPPPGPRALEEGERVRTAPSLSFRAVEREVERLFGSVLPTHPSLVEVKFSNDDTGRGSLPPTLAQLLFSRCGGSSGRPSAATATAPAATSKLRLRFDKFSLEDTTLQEMANALRRGAWLSLNVRRCHMDAVHFRLLLEAAADAPNNDMGCLSLDQVGNSRTNFLRVDETVLAGGVIERMPVGALGLASGRWTDAAYESLFRQLRTNTTIRVLFIKHTGRSIHLVDWVLELLNKYNFTLSFVNEIRSDSQGRVDELLGRNRRVYAVHKQMERLHYSLGDQPHHRALWPTALSQASRFPTLVYRFVRKGDVDGLADQLMLKSAESRNKKRGRGAPSSARR